MGEVSAESVGVSMAPGVEDGLVDTVGDVEGRMLGITDSRGLTV